MTHTRPHADFTAALARLPLVAILRGVRPQEVEPIGDALYQAGFRLIEVPMNSPDALQSLQRLARALPDDALLGAGTVLSPQVVDDVQQAGGRLIVMPHADVEVVRRARHLGMVVLPGVVTPTEAFAALHAGADGLKLFPAELVTPSGLKAMRAVLPPDLPMLPVGGIAPATMAGWRSAGADGFGLGSALYTPGLDAQAVGERARAFVAAWQALGAGHPER